jgi:hypothetical protein
MPEASCRDILDGFLKKWYIPKKDSIKGFSLSITGTLLE